MTDRDYLAGLVEHIGDAALDGSGAALSAETLSALVGIGQQLRRSADALEPVELMRAETHQVEKPEPVVVRDLIEYSAGVDTVANDTRVRIRCTGQSGDVASWLLPVDARVLADALIAHADWIEAQR